MKNSYFIILVLGIGLFFGVENVFADTVSVKTVSGSGAPGCEERGGCYSPVVLTINKGDSVRFINTDTAAHTYTSGTGDGGPDGIFDSSLVMASNTFTQKFSESGTYPYFCMVHPWMTGEIIVTSSGGSTYTPPPTYTSPTTSGTDWQSKYLEVLSDFNEVSAKVGDLQKQNNELRAQVEDMQTTIDNLNAVIMEQVKVIYDWVLGN